MWYVLTHEKKVISPFFFDEYIITSSSFLDMLENCALPQFSNNNNNDLIPQLEGAPVYFAHTVLDFERDFPRSMDRKRRTNCVAPFLPPDFMLMGCLKDPGVQP
jgi:hypothetical protein